MVAGTAKTAVRLIEDAELNEAFGPNWNDWTITGAAIPSYCVKLDESGLFD